MLKKLTLCLLLLGLTQPVYAANKFVVCKNGDNITVKQKCSKKETKLSYSMLKGTDGRDGRDGRDGKDGSSSTYNPTCRQVSQTFSGDSCISNAYAFCEDDEYIQNWSVLNVSGKKITEGADPFVISQSANSYNSKNMPYAMAVQLVSPFIGTFYQDEPNEDVKWGCLEFEISAELTLTCCK